ncbi:MAG: hypothetical protein IJ398_04235 [Clostridia bacterium]|nr:hypothetical protein [Clostridia bacterium]
MKTYFRITAYHKEKDFSVILDTYQMFEQLWEFSALLIEKGFDIIEVGRTEKFGEGNTPITDKYPNKIVIRATQNGKPNYKYVDVGGLTKKAVCVSFRYYIPQK